MCYPIALATLSHPDRLNHAQDHDPEWASAAFKGDVVILLAVLIICATVCKRFEAGTVSAATFRATKMAGKIILGTMFATYALYGCSQLKKIMMADSCDLFGICRCIQRRHNNSQDTRQWNNY